VSLANHQTEASIVLMLETPKDLPGKNSASMASFRRNEPEFDNTLLISDVTNIFL